VIEVLLGKGNKLMWKIKCLLKVFSTASSLLSVVEVKERRKGGEVK
jgi:hypothetical protein